MLSALCTLGGESLINTPSVYLSPNDSAPHVRYSTKSNPDEGIGSVGGELPLNKWYHLAYTLSEPEKQLKFYKDGQLVGIQSTKDEIVFNDRPLFIGNSVAFLGITGQIRYDFI